MSVRKDATYSYNRLCYSATSNTPFNLMFGLSIRELMANDQMDSILSTINDLVIERIEKEENI